MTNTEKLNTQNLPDSQKKWSNLWESVRKAIMVGLLGLTTLGTPSCSNWDKDPKENPTEIVDPKFSWTDVYDKTITDSIEWIIVCENPDTKQIFLSDWNNKLTEDFDDIREVGRFDGTIYYVWVNGWKPAIINEKWDTIFVWLDEIDSYTIRNWDIAISGKKGWKICLIFNNKTIDEWRDYWIHTNSNEGSKNWIYITATSYEWDSKNVSTFVNGKKVWPDFSYEYLEDWAFNWGCNISDYWEWYIILSYNDPNTSPLTWTLIYNWKIIWNNLDSLWRINNNLELISYVKNWKKYVLFTDGKEYAVDKSPEFDSDNSEIFVNDWKKSYYISDWELHESEWNFGSFIDHIWKTEDWKLYYIGYNEDGETFVLDWKIIWTLEHITWVWTTKDWTLYLKWWENVYSGGRWLDVTRRNVISINWTVREDLNPNEHTQEWLHMDN